MAERRANGTDAVICRLLAAGPLPTAELAARLGIPARTARHRLYRLRHAGTVVTGADGRHRLAGPARGLAAPAAELATTAIAAGTADGASGAVPAVGARMAATADGASGAVPGAGTGHGWPAVGMAVTVGVVGLGAAAAILAARRWTAGSVPASPAPAEPWSSWGTPAGLWGGIRW
jgi:hypothetical protein